MLLVCGVNSLCDERPFEKSERLLLMAVYSSGETDCGLLVALFQKDD